MQQPPRSRARDRQFRSATQRIWASRSAAVSSHVRCGCRRWCGGVHGGLAGAV